MSQLNHSPKHHLVAAGKIYPDIWRKIDEIRSSAPWPAWCFAPMSEIFTCIRTDWVGRSDIHNMTADVARLASLAAWRATQGIYQFDPDLYAALVTTPVERLPAEVLTLLPEWGVYIETPGNERFHGFFASCDYDPRNSSPELRLLLASEDNLIPIAIPIINGMLADAIDIATPGFGNALAGMCQPLISLVLYICSVSADFGHYSAFRPVPTKTKKGLRIFPPDKPKIIKTGAEIGAILRASRFSHNSSCLDGPTGRTLLPHVRRAHWHGYWLGKSKRFEIRWMPPILVKANEASEYTRQVV
ncbi:TPA: hypothetical protein LVM22_001182 [Klebsiella oxytoca]|nr:hypothetical protein [Klebsiella oxytoca]